MVTKGGDSSSRATDAVKSAQYGCGWPLMPGIPFRKPQG